MAKGQKDGLNCTSGQAERSPERSGVNMLRPCKKTRADNMRAGEAATRSDAQGGGCVGVGKAIQAVAIWSGSGTRREFTGRGIAHRDGGVCARREQVYRAASQ